ncbi:MAG: GreA/GreB family elongation factor [Gemmatimonadota bacterium]|jgi:transcription elongation factor GreA|nr:MAG: GreA/GreB family elongation factor [Gemmatimonadota bacterium]
MLDEIRERLSEETERLLHELEVVLPRAIQHALELGDLRENSEYHAALERQGFVHARLDYIRRRLGELADIDMESIPHDRIGFGSRVTLRDVEDGSTEVYTLAFGEHIDVEKDEISMASPIGRALLGRQPGDEISVSLPRATVRYQVVEFRSIHEVAGLDDD